MKLTGTQDANYGDDDVGTVWCCRKRINDFNERAAGSCELRSCDFSTDEASTLGTNGREGTEGTKTIYEMSPAQCCSLGSNLLSVRSMPVPDPCSLTYDYSHAHFRRCDSVARRKVFTGSHCFIKVLGINDPIRRKLRWLRLRRLVLWLCLL